MDRYLWKAHVLPGKLEEYIRRHDEIWPEMTKMLNDAGIRNYSIWNLGNELYGYYECDDLQKTLQFEAASEVNKRWQASMKGLMEMERDPETGEAVRLQIVFLHEGK